MIQRTDRQRWKPSGNHLIQEPYDLYSETCLVFANPLAGRGSQDQRNRNGEVLMKAVVFHGVGDIRLDEVKDPKLFAI
jgi:hypothetical protein